MKAYTNFKSNVKLINHAPNIQHSKSWWMRLNQVMMSPEQPSIHHTQKHITTLH